MSQTQSDPLQTDLVHTLPIDEAGELARFEVAGGATLAPEPLLELTIDGDAPASYTLEFGARDAEDRSLHWFDVPDDFSYSSTDRVDDTWRQARHFVRIWIDEPATAGSEARVVLTDGH